MTSNCPSSVTTSTAFLNEQERCQLAPTTSPEEHENLPILEPAPENVFAAGTEAIEGQSIDAVGVEATPDPPNSVAEAKVSV